MQDIMQLCGVIRETRFPLLRFVCLFVAKTSRKQSD